MIVLYSVLRVKISLTVEFVGVQFYNILQGEYFFVMNTRRLFFFLGEGIGVE